MLLFLIMLRITIMCKIMKVYLVQQYQDYQIALINLSTLYTYVTGPEKTGLIYTKYTCSYYGNYILLFISFTKSVTFIEFILECYIYDMIQVQYRVKRKSYYNSNYQIQVEFCIQIRLVISGQVTYSNLESLFIKAVNQENYFSQLQIVMMKRSSANLILKLSWKY